MSNAPCPCISFICKNRVSFGCSLTDNPLDITIVMFILTFFVTLYRCYARYTKKLWWHDDSVALFSMLSFTIFLIGSYSVHSCRFSARQIVEADKFIPAILGAIYLAQGMVLHP